jgi:serine/threonine protein kinase
MSSAHRPPRSGAQGTPPPVSKAPQPFRGAVLNGKYTLIDKLGAGGMGDIWEARRDLEARVAVKFQRLPSGCTPGDLILLARLFKAEVAHLLALQGTGEPTGVVTLLDHDVWQPPGGGPGLPYFVMPILEGRPFDEALALRELPAKLGCFLEVCDAVARVHARRRLHLDLKPDNIVVIEKAGRLHPVLVDFGLAIPFQPGVPLPLECVGRGTRRFMAPEQWSLGAGTIGYATDVWALGVTLFALLTGRHPCRLETKRTEAAMRRAILAGPKITLVELCPDLPRARELSDLLGRALDTHPDRRLLSAAHFADALRVLLSAPEPGHEPPQDPLPSCPPQPPGPLPNPGQRAARLQGMAAMAGGLGTSSETDRAGGSAAPPPPLPPAPAPTPPIGVPLVRTIVELDLKGYSDLARDLEQNLGVLVVARLNEQIQGFVEAGLSALDRPPHCAVLGTAGDNAFVVFERPEQAHRFARAFYAAVKAHNDSKTVESARRWFRLGAATGEICYTLRDGRSSAAGMAISDAVRLEAAAQPGELLVDARTYAALPASMQAEYQDEETVPGKRKERFQARRV